MRADAASYRDEVVDFWREQPGEKARLALQATGMLWSPVPRDSDESGNDAVRLARKTMEPGFVVGLYVLALVGLFVAPRHFVGLATTMLAYNTLAATVFAGSARYRTPWTSCSRCSPPRSQQPGNVGAAAGLRQGQPRS